MNQHAVEVMAGRVQRKELVIESMREPSQGMPIRRRFCGREGPLDRGPPEAATNIRIRRDINIVIPPDKRVPSNWTVEKNRHCREQSEENCIQLVAGEERRVLRRLGLLAAAFSA